MSKRSNSSEGHVSFWPSYYRDSHRKRLLAYLSPIYDTDSEKVTGYYLRTEKDDMFSVKSLGELVSTAAANNMDVYVHRISAKRDTNDFIWLAEAEEMGATIIVPHSSGIISNISFKLRRSKVVKIIAVSAWGYSKPPDMLFLHALRNVFDKVGIGEHASQGSLGQELMIEWHRRQEKRRFHRPTQALRHRLIKYGSGGRKDDFELEYGMGYRYQSDKNNSYADQASSGVPVSGCETIRLIDWYTHDLSELAEYKVSFCQSRITVPEGFNDKFGPFYVRNPFGGLEWVKKPGTYYGWYWTPMLTRAMRAGCEVEIGFCYCWRDLDDFLAAWARDLIEDRYYFRDKGMQLEEDLTKGIIVAAIGYFAIRDEKQLLVGKSHRQEGDEPYLNLYAATNESMLTDFYIRTIPQMDSNYLTQVAYYIIMRNNVELYDRAIAEEAAGNIVTLTYYDMIETQLYPTQPISPTSMGGWKVKVIQDKRGG